MNFILLPLLLVCGTVTSAPDYYWRPFNGTIPGDAFEATSVEDDKTYVGTAPVFDGGLYIGQLVADKIEITVTGDPKYYGSRVHIKNDLIHILCVPEKSKSNYQWIETTSSNVMSLSSLKVEGGYEGIDDDKTHIGRVKYFSTYIIGKVTDYNNGGGILYYFDGDSEAEAHEYEILVYKEDKV